MPKKITEDNIIKQKEILDKIYNIVGVNSTNKSFLLQDIDADEEKINCIYALEPEIKKHFISGTWSCFKKPQDQQERKWYNMIKAVCKECDVEYSTKTKNIINKDGTVKSLTQFTLMKKNSLLDQTIESIIIEKVNSVIQNITKINNETII
jgi:hypothetical protein